MIKIKFLYEIKAQHPTENPEAGTYFLYPHSDGKWYTKDSSGTVAEFKAGHNIKQNLTSLAQQPNLNFVSPEFELTNNVETQSTEIRLKIDANSVSNNPNSGIAPYDAEKVYKYNDYVSDNNNIYRFIGTLSGAYHIEKLSINYFEPDTDPENVNYSVPRYINLAGTNYLVTVLTKESSSDSVADEIMLMSFPGWTISRNTVIAEKEEITFTATSKGIKTPFATEIGTFTQIQAGTAEGAAGIPTSNTDYWEIESGIQHTHPNKPIIDIIDQALIDKIIVAYNHANDVNLHTKTKADWVAKTGDSEILNKPFVTLLNQTGSIVYLVNAGFSLDIIEIKKKSGTPSVKIGLTAGAEDYLENSEYGYITATIRTPYASATNIYITITNGYIDIIIHSKKIL